MTRRIHDFLPEVKDYYTIDDQGRIYSDNCGLRKTVNKNSKSNYQRIKLMVHTQREGKMFNVHRLVMMAFAPREDMEQLQVNHKDGDKTNNALSNLEWATPLENTQHSIKMGLKPVGERVWNHKLTWDNVREIRRMKKENVMSQNDMAKMFNVDPKTISRIVRNETWKER